MIVSLSNYLGNEDVKFLGVTLESNMKWNIHIENISKKLARGIVAWGHSSEMKKLMILQKRAVRSIYNVNGRMHCKPLIRKLKILMVPSLYILECLLYLKSYLHEIETNNNIHNHDTRQNSLLHRSRCNLQMTLNSFHEFGKKIYNLLPSEVRSMNMKNFKKYIKHMLCELCVYNVKEFVEYLTRDNTSVDL